MIQNQYGILILGGAHYHNQYVLIVQYFRLLILGGPLILAPTNLGDMCTKRVALHVIIMKTSKLIYQFKGEFIKVFAHKISIITN